MVEWCMVQVVVWDIYSAFKNVHAAVMIYIFVILAQR